MKKFIKFIGKNAQVICAIIAFVAMFMSATLVISAPFDNWLISLILLGVAALFIQLGKLGNYEGE